MLVWRLVAPRHAERAMTGEGAALYGGRWNPVGRRMVYTAESLALATLELAVHLTGGRAKYTAIQFDVADELVDHLETGDLRRTWQRDAAATARIGDAWSASLRSVALTVPSALVDPRSGERNVLWNPAHPDAGRLREVQRFAVTLDERL
jgi:RES domain-containing protein